MDPADGAAKIIVNSRTGTIVIGSQVKLKPAAITHGGLTVTISENPQVSQPNAFSEGTTTVVLIPPSTSSKKIAACSSWIPAALWMIWCKPSIRLGSPQDLMAILEALQQAGAIEGELVIL